MSLYISTISFANINMRKALLILVFFNTFFGVSIAQEYYEFPDSNTYWYEWHRPALFWWPGHESYSNIFGLLNQDTLINDKYYHKLFKFNNDSLLQDSAKYVGAIREDENKKVFYVGPDYYGEGTYDSVDIILYDFSLSVGDTFTNGLFTINENLIVSEIDSVLIGDTYRRRINFQNYSWVKWIEGIGNQSGVIFYSGDLPTNGIWNWLVCYSENDEILYHNPEFEECYYYNLTNIDNNFIDFDVIIKPNPCNGSFITVISESKINSILIYNLLGDLVLHKKSLNNNYYKIDVKNLNKGSYILKAILDNKEKVVKKLLIQ